MHDGARHSPGIEHAVPPVDPHLGTLVGGRYRIVRKLGQGGMGAVYLAQHMLIQCSVAIKILSESYSKDPEILGRFLQEARSAARVRHPNTVQVFDFGETEQGSFYLVMEYLEGQCLAQLVRGGPRLPPARVRHILVQVCEGLGAIHAQGIIHRDLKPENIFLVEGTSHSECVKILDFGLAKISEAWGGERRLTRAGMTLGTPEYMSPEQVLAEPLDPRSDIYSLGCILYEMLTGVVPLPSTHARGALVRHVEDPVTPPSALAAVPPALEAICMRALEKDRESRFRSTPEMALALCAAGHEGPPSAGAIEPSEVQGAEYGAVPEAPPAPRPRRQPFRLGQVAALLLCASPLSVQRPARPRGQDASMVRMQVPAAMHVAGERGASRIPAGPSSPAPSLTVLPQAELPEPPPAPSRRCSPSALRKASGRCARQ